MVHRIRIFYGDYEVSYEGEAWDKWGNWLQDVIQVDHCRSVVWHVLGSVIFNILHKRGFMSENIYPPYQNNCSIL